MPTFKVFLQREIVEEIAINIEAEKEEVIANWCSSYAIYEGVAATKNARHWKSVVNEVWLDPDRIESTDAEPEFEVYSIDRDWEIKKVLKKPKVDPRQLSLTEDSNG